MRKLLKGTLRNVVRKRYDSSMIEEKLESAKEPAKNKITYIRLTVPMYERCQELAKKHDVSVSEVCRILIEAGFEAKDKEEPKAG